MAVPRDRTDRVDNKKKVSLSFAARLRNLGIGRPAKARHPEPHGGTDTLVLRQGTR